MNEIGCLLLMACVAFLLAFSLLVMWFVAGDNPLIWLILIAFMAFVAWAAWSKARRDLRDGTLTAEEFFEEDEDL